MSFVPLINVGLLWGLAVGQPTCTSRGSPLQHGLLALRELAWPLAPVAPSPQSTGLVGRGMASLRVPSEPESWSPRGHPALRGSL